MNFVTSSPSLDYISSNGAAAAMDDSSSYGSMEPLSGSALIAGPPGSFSRSSHDVEQALNTLLNFFNYGGFIEEAMIVFGWKGKFMTSAQQ
jgi:hypothetical protein